MVLYFILFINDNFSGLVNLYSDFIYVVIFRDALNGAAHQLRGLRLRFIDVDTTYLSPQSPAARRLLLTSVDRASTDTKSVDIRAENYSITYNGIILIYI